MTFLWYCVIAAFAGTSTLHVIFIIVMFSKDGHLLDYTKWFGVLVVWLISGFVIFP